MAKVKGYIQEKNKINDLEAGETTQRASKYI